MIFVSPASLWEIAIKISLGKYALPAPFSAFWDDQLLTNNFTLLSISMSHTARVVDLPFHHRDPFDRLIIAQSLVEGTPVASSDEMFDRYGVKRVWRKAGNGKSALRRIWRGCWRGSDGEQKT
ncbi:type II toxin-antitoxin system VapC family toxin [Candidatus Amarolinea dominans]|uniref:type II toxin-antitoxin system VapC family toxin n=1 Tax=Candidatus Amarolinea dominans TaxID=3140696 RepID=UPI0031CC9EFC